ncbi:hypothetical protein [Paracidovorax citrulli]
MATEPKPESQTSQAQTGSNPGTAAPGNQPHGTPENDKQRGADPAGGRDLPDENGEPPSVRQPGDPDASEPPVENF